MRRLYLSSAAKLLFALLALAASAAAAPAQTTVSVGCQKNGDGSYAVHAAVTPNLYWQSNGLYWVVLTTTQANGNNYSQGVSVQPQGQDAGGYYWNTFDGTVPASQGFVNGDRATVAIYWIQLNTWGRVSYFIASGSTTWIDSVGGSF